MIILIGEKNHTKKWHVHMARFWITENPAGPIMEMQTGP